jgi:D-threo-aldose 1-dehydrogenase
MVNPVAVAEIGRTGIQLTRLGLGTAPLGGWPTAVTHEAGQATIAAAWEAGLRYFDTAPLYGYGQSEEWLGEGLRDKPRHAFRLSTKVGKRLVPSENEPVFFKGDHRMTAVEDFTADGAWRSIEESLSRLGIDSVDLALIHDADQHLDEAIAGSFTALAEMRSQGIVGAIGAGMNSASNLSYLARRADFDCVLLAGRYTLLDQEALDELLPQAAERGFSVIAGGIFNSGILADPRPGATYDYAIAPPKLIERTHRLRRLCKSYRVPLKAAALQFPLAHPAIVSIVTGARTPEEIIENVDLVERPIPAELWDEMVRQGLIRDDSPTPRGSA